MKRKKVNPRFKSAEAGSRRLFDDMQKDRKDSIAHEQEMSRLNGWEKFWLGIISGIVITIFGGLLLKVLASM